MVNNVESIVVVFMIIWCGVFWFVGLGCLNNMGMKVYCILGYVNKFCNVEEEMSIFLCMLFEMYVGGVWGGWDNFKVVILGGLFVFFIFKEICDSVLMDFDVFKDV